jgi:hypothetical protein
LKTALGKKQSQMNLCISAEYLTVSHVILERKASQLKGSSEKVNSFT